MYKAHEKNLDVYLPLFVALLKNYSLNVFVLHYSVSFIRILEQE